ncbi:MAG: hypothetical protein KAR33_11030 [Candidatus Thorarchaeota archaeon]|nr:hypothetical protein [Candidatus Thorarchaeota archaeon]
MWVKELKSGRTNTTQVVALVVALIVVAAGSYIITTLGAVEPQPDILETFTIETWVPVSLLRDPPGSDSYSMLFLRDSSQITLGFETSTEGVNVTGEFSSRLIRNAYYTSESNNSDVILLVKLNQTWNVWTSLSDENNIVQVELASCNVISDTEVVNIDDAITRGVWMQGSPSAIYMGRHTVWLGADYHELEFRFSRNPFSWKQFKSIRAGYFIEILGEQIPITVLLDLEGSTLCTKSFLYDESRFLNYSIMSSGPVEYQYPDLYICSGMFVWFDF